MSARLRPSTCRACWAPLGRSDTARNGPCGACTHFAPKWVHSRGQSCYTPDLHVNAFSSSGCLTKPPNTVGECKSAEMSVPHMPTWKAKMLGKLTQERVLLEP